MDNLLIIWLFGAGHFFQCKYKRLPLPPSSNLSGYISSSLGTSFSAIKRWMCLGKTVVPILHFLGAKPLENYLAT